MAALIGQLAARADGAELAIGPEHIARSGTALSPLEGAGGVVGLCITDPIRLIETLIALDGHVEALVLLSHSLTPDTVATLARQAGCQALLSDRGDLALSLPLHTPQEGIALCRGPACETRWMMTTSGTTGLPKLIPHKLASLTRSVARQAPRVAPRWGLLYDPTRFAGMQVVLQSLIGGGTLIAPDTHAPLAEQIAFLAAHGCSHLSATPTLWRRLLMAPGFADLALTQITLGGEIVDQQVLDSLRAAHPKARITHIYASTEAGVGFTVTDGKAGFPLSYIKEGLLGIDLKIRDDILWLRPPKQARRSLAGTGIEVDEDDFICSGDRIEITEARAFFLGRDNGTINVGGVKIHPEMVEHTIMQVEGVRLVRITSKKSPIAGALVVAEVLADEEADRDALKRAIQTHCKANLEREAIPAAIRFVENLTMNAAGKLIRTDV